MANASLDENTIATLLAISMIDLATPVTLAVDPVTHCLIVELV